MVWFDPICYNIIWCIMAKYYIAGIFTYCDRRYNVFALIQYSTAKTVRYTYTRKHTHAITNANANANNKTQRHIHIQMQTQKNTKTNTNSKTQRHTQTQLHMQMQTHKNTKNKYKQQNTKTYTNQKYTYKYKCTCKCKRKPKHTQTNTNNKTQRHTQIQIHIQTQTQNKKAQKQIQTTKHKYKQQNTKTHTNTNTHANANAKRESPKQIQHNTIHVYVLHHAEHVPIELDENCSCCGFGEVQAPTARLGWAVPWQENRNDTGTTQERPETQGQTCHPDAMFPHYHAAATWRSKVWSGHELYQCRWLRLSSRVLPAMILKTKEIIPSSIFLGQNAQVQKGSNTIQQVCITAVLRHMFQGYWVE